MSGIASSWLLRATSTVVQNILVGAYISKRPKLMFTLCSAYVPLEHKVKLSQVMYCQYKNYTIVYSSLFVEERVFVL